MNALSGHSQRPKPTVTDSDFETEKILDFRVDYLAHNSMSRPCSDVKRRCLNVALIRKRPLVVLGGQLAYWILIFCSGDDGLKGVGTILRLGGASNARNTSHGQLKP